MKILKTANYKELFDKLSEKEKQEHVRNFEEGLKKELKRNEEPLHSLDIHCDGEDDGY